MCIHYSAQFKKWHNLYLWNLSVHLPASFPVFSPLRGESCHFLPYHSFACHHSFTKYVSICKQHFVQIYVYLMYIYYIYLSLMSQDWKKLLYNPRYQNVLLAVLVPGSGFVRPGTLSTNRHPWWGLSVDLTLPVTTDCSSLFYFYFIRLSSIMCYLHHHWIFSWPSKHSCVFRVCFFNALPSLPLCLPWVHRC